MHCNSTRVEKARIRAYGRKVCSLRRGRSPTCIVNSAPELRVKNTFLSYFRILYPYDILNVEANGNGRTPADLHLSGGLCPLQIPTLELTIMTASLPDEILLKIIEQITAGPTRANARERNILPLLVANKQWCRVATEILYRSVHIVSPGMLDRFLHTVLHYPSYSALVRELKIGYVALSPSFATIMAPYTHRYDENITQAIQTYQLIDVTTYNQGMYRHFNITKVLVLLCILHELMRLEIEPNDDLIERFVAVDGHASRKLHVLDVDLRNRPTDGYLTTLYPLFWVRSIKQLILHNVTPFIREDEYSVSGEERLGASTIEKLVIWNAYMVSGTLVRLLRLPQKLKEFKYQDDGPRLRTVYHFPALQPALNQVSHTLVVLCIAWYNVGPLTQDDIRIDLRGFPRLKKVAIALELLLGCYPDHNTQLQQKLPIGLEVLYLRMAALWPKAASRWNNESYVATVRDLVVCKNERLFPRLGVICMGDKDHLTSLRDLARKQVVSLEWEDHPESLPFE